MCAGNTSYETFNKRLTKFINWKADTTSFFNSIIEQDLTEDPLWRAVVEQYNEEKS